MRRQAYAVLGDKIDVKALTIADRIAVLKTGLHDRFVTSTFACSYFSVAAVREACLAMAGRGWLACAGSLVSLLSMLDVENDTAICAEMSTELLKTGVTSR